VRRPALAGASLRTETLAGVTTFLTLSYILFVQPTVMALAGIDPGAALTATCLASAAATLFMGLAANYPIAVAPAMGHNFWFALGVASAGGLALGWQRALGAVFLAGVLFTLLTLSGLRERLLAAIPASLQHAIGGGIGLLITLIGLQWAGIVVAAPGTMVRLGDLKSPPALVALLGIALTSVLMARRVPGAFLLGIAGTALIAIPFGLVHWHGVTGAPASLAPTFAKLDVVGALAFPKVVAVFLFLAVFDTLGTLVAVADRAGFLRDGKLPRARTAMLADSLGTMLGAVLGTSTVTAYVESTAGVLQGGRTGFASVVTALCLLGSVFLHPLVQAIGGGHQLAGGGTLYPVTAPVLVLIGSLMVSALAGVPWDEPAEAIPAFLAAVMIPLTFSIAEGIAFGLVAASLLELFRRGVRRSALPLHLLAAAIVAGYFAM